MKITRRRALGAGVLALGAFGAARYVDFRPQLLPGRSRARPVPTDSILPASADVVVIGGGNAGAAAAYYLAKRGLSVVLCEKGAIAGEASGRSAGHVHSSGMEVDKLPVALAAKQLWSGINQELQIETGYRQFGLVTKIADDAEREMYRKWIDDTKALTSTARIIDSSEVQRLANTSQPWHGALYDPTDGSAEPTLTAPAFAEAARRLGAVLLAPCAVRGIERSAGHLSAVITERGAITTRCAILAGGAWSPRFLGSLGSTLPLFNVVSQCVEYQSTATPSVNAIFDSTHWRRHYNGGFTTSHMHPVVPITPAIVRNWWRYWGTPVGGVGALHMGIIPRFGSVFFEELFTPTTWRLDEVSPFEKRRILDPPADQTILSKALQKVRQTNPAFQDLRITETWGGVVSVAADMKPVLGPLDSIPGLILATGFLEGLCWAPAIGSAVADIVTGRPPTVQASKVRSRHTSMVSIRPP